MSQQNNLERKYNQDDLSLFTWSLRGEVPTRRHFLSLFLPALTNVNSLMSHWSKQEAWSNPDKAVERWTPPLGGRNYKVNITEKCERRQEWVENRDGKGLRAFL